MIFDQAAYAVLMRGPPPPIKEQVRELRRHVAHRTQECLDKSRTHRPSTMLPQLREARRMLDALK